MNKLKGVLKNILTWYKVDKGKKFYKRRWFVTFIILIILWGIGSSDSSNKIDVKAEKKVEVVKPIVKPVIKLTPEQIAENKKIADAKAVEKKRVADAKAIEDKKVADAKAIVDAKVAEQTKYKTWVDSQFSLWNGSHKALVDLIKENLNDKKSFEHEKTTYIDKGTYLIVKMTYRAKNGFGGTILQNVTAKADYKTNVISVISQNN